MIIIILGQRLCASDKVIIPGAGTYEERGYIYSKVAGIVKFIKEENVCIKMTTFSFYSF